MGWKGNQFFYSKRILKVIAEHYINIYEGLPLYLNGEITNPWALAEFRADFDIALRGIGKGKWDGRIWDFGHYRNYGKLQQIIIADILGVADYELIRLGFYDNARLRGYSYYCMVKFLNGGNNVSQNNS